MTLKKLKVCFVGIGSIAKRHIKNLTRISFEDGINLSIDAVRRNGNKENDDIYNLIENVFPSVEALTATYDAIFITNPTEYHLDTLQKVTPLGKNFFIEKPIVSLSQLNDIEHYEKKAEAVYYVACPLRYNAVIQYIKNNIIIDDVFAVRSISSSYLPDWRPGQDYRDTYSAHKSLGGGVSIDLIHEWDYLFSLFGKPIKVACMSGKKSNLEIDSEDYAIYIAEYLDKTVELHLDYFGRKTIRDITLFTKDDTIVGDIANNRITYLKSGKTKDFHEERDDFQVRELRHFLEMIDGKCAPDSDINHAIKVLKLTQGVL